MGMSLTVTGLDNLVKKLQRLDKKVETKALKQSVRSAAKPVQAAAKSRVPVDSGVVKRSIGTKVKKYKGGASAIIGPRKGFKSKKHSEEEIKTATRVATMLEYGTPPHKIDITVDGKEVTLNHPGAAAKPFMRPAFEQNKAKAKSIMAEELMKVINSEAGK